MALPHHVKELAAATVSRNETMQQIRLVAVNTIDAPLSTPKTGGLRVGSRAMLDYLWKGNAVPVPEAGRECDDGR